VRRAVATVLATGRGNHGIAGLAAKRLVEQVDEMDEEVIEHEQLRAIGPWQRLMTMNEWALGDLTGRCRCFWSA
jgi:hypothetical protein